MALELRGKLVKILTEQTGKSKNGEWKKQDFVIETVDAYPKKVCFTVWNDKMSLLDSLQEGDDLRVMFGVASREYNERWYTDITAFAIEKVTPEITPSDTALPSKNIDDINDQIATISDEENDDLLPF